MSLLNNIFYFQHVRLAGLIPASSYIFQVRSHNARGFSSDFTRPSQMFSTLTEDGVDMTAISSSKSSLLNPRTLTFIVAAIAFLIFINFCLLCCYQKRQRRKKIQGQLFSLSRHSCIALTATTHREVPGNDTCRTILLRLFINKSNIVI